MASNVKRDRKIKLFSKIAAILCLVAAALAFTIARSNPSYNTEQATTVKIKSGNDIAKRRVSLYNDNIVLENDITIDDSDALIGSSELPFEGTFDGKGHTVRLNYGNADELTSLFGYIGKNAVIKNVTFVFDNINVNCPYFGGIARVNDGTISNCKIECENLTITRQGIFSPLVTINNGEISDVVVGGSINGAILEADDEERVLFGTVCVYNAGKITRIIADSTFSGFKSTNESNIHAGSAKNFGISALRYKDIDDGKLVSAFEVVKTGQVSYEQAPGTVENSIEFISSANLYKYEKIFTRIGFKDEIWELTDSALVISIEGNK